MLSRVVFWLTRSKANALQANWGTTIFQSANEIAANTTFRKRLDEIQAQTAAEKEWWDKRRASINSQKEPVKELATASAPSATEPIPSAKTSTIDEDTVLVESGGPAASSTGSIRKKKSKK